LGATALTAALVSVLPLLGLWIAAYIFIDRTFKGETFQIGTRLFVRAELLGIPLLLLCLVFLAPRLLRRENVLMKYV
jgi:hypothetical protein